MKVYLIYFLAIIFDSIISLVHLCRTIGEECCKNGFLNKNHFFHITFYGIKISYMDKFKDISYLSLHFLHTCFHDLSF